MMQQIVFYFDSKKEQKNGDNLLFGFVVFNQIKTYCYISYSQIKSLENDFTFQIKHIIEKPKELKTTYWKKEEAFSKNKTINSGLFYLAKVENSYQEKQSLHKFKVYKKTPILEVLLSDKPELFYNIKTKVSYKRIYQFRYGDFEKPSQGSVFYDIGKLSSINELSKYIFGSDSKEFTKLTWNIIFKIGKDHSEIDWCLIRFIIFSRKFFNEKEVLQLFSNIESVKNSKFYSKYFWNFLYLKSYNNPVGMSIFFSQIKDFNTKKRLFLNWNIPSHILDKFSKVMEVAYFKFNQDLSLIKDPLFFYNTLSRDYGRLFVKDFNLQINDGFKNLAKAIDGESVDGLIFKIPKTYHELVKWGAILHNCAGNFDQIEYYSTSLLIGIFKEDKLLYLADLKEDSSCLKLKQLKGFKNGNVKDDSHLKIIKDLFFKYSISLISNL